LYGEKRPKTIVLVFEPIQDNIALSSRITLTPNAALPYLPETPTEEKSGELLQQISPDNGYDRSMYNLESEFIHDIQTWKYTDAENLARGDAIILQYIQAMEQYTMNNRHYALGFKRTGKSNIFPIYGEISKQADEGYYCSIAALSLTDGLNAAGIPAFIVNIAPSYQIDNLLWTDLGHAIVHVFLPSGDLLEVDLTPPTTQETPTEDILLLKTRYPSYKQEIIQIISEFIQKKENLFPILGIMTSILTISGGIFLTKKNWDKIQELFHNVRPPEIDVLNTVLATTIEMASKGTDQLDLNALEILSKFEVEIHGELTKWLMQNQVGIDALIHLNTSEAFFQLSTFLSDPSFSRTLDHDTLEAYSIFQQMREQKVSSGEELVPASFLISFQTAQLCFKYRSAKTISGIVDQSTILTGFSKDKQVSSLEVIESLLELKGGVKRDNLHELLILLQDILAKIHE